MKRFITLAILAALLSVPAVAAGTAGVQPFAKGRLQVDATSRYLCHADGTPFLYLADTAWELFARLSVADAGTYLENRRLKGFTVIQAVILTELDDTIPSVGVPAVASVSRQGVELHPRYLAHIDSVVDMAASKGLYIALLPTWGDKVSKEWGKGPVIFDRRNARAYGERLGRHFSSRPNIIWVIGGDRGGDGDAREVWNALARGIKHSDGNHLMTYHPHGEHSSSVWFHDEEWLDFNMFQSGHCQDSYEIYRRLLLPDYNRRPVKPVMDGEPRYENIPYGFDARNRRFTAYDVRKTLYQSMLSGACGYTYGCNDIWQMYAPGLLPACDANRYWYLSLDTEGAGQLAYFRRLWLAFPFSEAKPMPQVLEGYTGDDAAVAFGNDSYLLCYFPTPVGCVLSLPDTWQGVRYELTVLDPATGFIYPWGIDDRMRMEVSAPLHHNLQDWVLIIKKI